MGTSVRCLEHLALYVKRREFLGYEAATLPEALRWLNDLGPLPQRCGYLYTRP